MTPDLILICTHPVGQHTRASSINAEDILDFTCDCNGYGVTVAGDWDDENEPCLPCPRHACLASRDGEPPLEYWYSSRPQGASIGDVIHPYCARPMDEFAPDGCDRPFDHEPDYAEYTEWMETMQNDEIAALVEQLIEELAAYEMEPPSDVHRWETQPNY